MCWLDRTLTTPHQAAFRLTKRRELARVVGAHLRHVALGSGLGDRAVGTAEAAAEIP